MKSKFKIKKIIYNKNNYIVAKCSILESLEYKNIPFVLKGQKGIFKDFLYEGDILEGTIALKINSETYNYEALIPNDLRITIPRTNIDLLMFVKNKLNKELLMSFKDYKKIAFSITVKEVRLYLEDLGRMNLKNNIYYYLANDKDTITNGDYLKGIFVDFINYIIGYYSNFSDLLDLFENSNVSSKYITRLLNSSMDIDIIGVLKTNPYVFSNIISIEILDKIYVIQSNKFSEEKRLEELLYFYLYEKLNNNTIFSQKHLKADLLNKFYTSNHKCYLYKKYDDKEIMKAFKKLIKTGYVIELKENIYTLKFLYEAEKNIINFIKKYKVDDNIFNYDNNMDYLDNNNVFIINGAAGTGKTTLVSRFCERSLKGKYSEDEVFLLSPTGKASSVLNAVIDGFEANTIHSKLSINSLTNLNINEKNIYGFSHNRDNFENIKVIIVDEASMIDVPLMDALLKSINFDIMEKLIFIGDYNQLKSIEKGNVLEDMINLGIKTLMLTEFHRQKNGSGILKNAMNILNGEDIKEYDDFKISIVPNNDKLMNDICEKYKALMDTTNPFEIGVLAPTNVGFFGVKSLNEYLREIYMSKFNSEKTGFEFNNINYYEGEILVATKNFRTYDLELEEEVYFTNGTRYLLDDFSENEESIYLTNYISGEVYNIDMNNLNYFNLGYVTTIHKSQGSGFQKIIIVGDSKKGSMMINKHLLYTAITRAKEDVCIFMDSEKFLTESKKNEPKRYTISNYFPIN